ncbi:coiled-coil domain-containing protein 138 isoform X1 [Ictalurus punctatus]|uniref:Coiled-coil domain-containing protein 138 isoform X1 n=1 Tax=Ictalurus punctatus TaxID=7998 RepID=A0A2D0R6G3_ICTPU|nr:coiled-coil domain-containing protein 138 isoform X1 [Ictalurus punctatus]
MSSEFSGSDLDIKVEILKRKYLERRNRVSATEGAEVSEKCGGAVEKPTKCCAVRGREEVTSRRELKSYSRALEELFQAVSDPPAGLERDESVLSSEDELSDQTDILDRTNILCTETDVTLPSSVACTSSSLETEPARFSGGEGLRSQVPVEQVYQEMIEIYERLQVRAAELCERECELQRREKLLLKHQSTVNRLLTVEEDVLDRMNAMQQEHQQEMENLRAALREKTKENKRIKSSFDSIKELNDTMKKQLSEVSEQNTRLESQSRKVQARLENLQRKHEHSVSQRVRENVVLKSRDLKPSNQDKPPPPNKASKSSSSSSVLKLLWYLMDWMVDGPPFSSEDMKTEREFDPFEVPRPSLHERCAKVLPVLLEQFQQAEAFLHSPLLRFIYCALTQLEHSTQHLPLTSTLRRLGEEVNRKSPPLFRSSCPHTRFLSSIIVLKTLSQADILAQALDVLNGIVGEDEGRGLFLKYKALTAILAVLRTGSPGLLAPSLDVLLHMSTESRHLPAFLEACSTDQFFRCAAVLLRNPRLDLTVAEKLSVLLQKLSCIRKNRRLFEASSLHLLLQEAQCSADPSRAFLNINFSSILFNLGVASRS